MNHEKRQWREALGNKRFLIAIAGLWLIGGLLILNWLTHIPSMFLKLMKRCYIRLIFYGLISPICW